MVFHLKLALHGDHIIKLRAIAQNGVKNPNLVRQRAAI